MKPLGPAFPVDTHIHVWHIDGVSNGKVNKQKKT